MAHQAQDGERCQGNRRADLKILEDKGKLGVKPKRGCGKFNHCKINLRCLPHKKMDNKPVIHGIWAQDPLQLVPVGRDKSVEGVSHDEQRGGQILTFVYYVGELGVGESRV